MPKSKSGGTKSTSKKSTKAATDEDEDGPVTGIERVFDRKTLLPNWKAFSEYVEEHGGPKIKPEHVGIVLTGYKYFQKSDAAIAAREEAAEMKAAQAEEREAAREAKRQAAEARAAEREQAKADREKAKAEKGKSTKGKSAAKASKAGTAKKATAAKKAAPATKKKAGKGKAKAAY